MIPRLIHFTGKTQERPRQMATYYAKWQRLHPGWEVRLWTDASMRDFVAESYPEFLAVYDGYPRMIQRADAFRYLVLGKLGGIYADLWNRQSGGFLPDQTDPEEEQAKKLKAEGEAKALDEASEEAAE